MSVGDPDPVTHVGTGKRRICELRKIFRIADRFREA